jgi:hypothetical protein
MVNGIQKHGWYDLTWNGMTVAGVPVVSGLYFYRIEARTVDSGDRNTFVQNRKMVLLK